MNASKHASYPLVIWIERLSLPGALYLAARALLTGAAIRFDEHRVTPAARILARLLGPDLFAPAGLRLNVVDARGEGLVYRRCENLSRAVAAFCARALPGAPETERRMTECFMATELLARAGFLTMVERAAEAYPGARHEARVRGHFLNRALIDHFESAGLAVRQSAPGPEGLRFAAIPLVLVLKSVWHWLTGSAPETAKRPAVWIEQAPQGAVWDQFQALAGAFASSSPRAYDVAYYFDRADTPYDEAAVRRLAAGALRAQPLFDVTAHAGIGPRELAALAAKAWRASSLGAWWLPFFRLHAELIRAFHASVFRAHGVKVLIQHQETSWKQEPKARAIEDAGGLMLGLHWSSYEHYDFPSHLTPQHAFFAWGAAHRDILEKRGLAREKVLPSGVWLPALDREEARPRFSSGVKLTLAVFDSDAYYDLYMSPESLGRFYSWLADLLERRCEIGVLLKPKTIKPGTTGLEGLCSLPGGAALAERFDRLRAQGRLVVLDGGAFTPLDAARWADFSVSFGLNTAGFLAALRGVPSLQWDCTGWLRHPLYTVAGQQVVFTSLDAMGAAFERALAGDRSVGALGPFLSRINHFGDFRGFDRIFGFIDAFMVRLAAGEERRAALDATAARYRAEHGVEDS